MARALEGLQVVELGRRFAASYATKLMADLGAGVIKWSRPAATRQPASLRRRAAASEKAAPSCTSTATSRA